MGKIKLIGTLALAALLLVLLPATAQAQLAVATVFYGNVTVAGKSVADGTVVTATVDGTKIGEAKTTTTAGVSSYYLDGAGTAAMEGKTVKFTVGTDAAQQTGTFKSFGGTKLDLTAGAALPVTGDETVPLLMLGMAALGLMALSAGYALRRRTAAHAA
ncbi:MAG: LPXTG cell wall anchor domain-containing protein [Chloroflexi bacterium]|nr:LPXTG cell wall anchor domain-containing protein [Chloroflexota bacterium]